MTCNIIEQELERHGRGLFQTVGDSMEPVLHNRKSTVVIEKPVKALQKYDVVLYRRPTGEYVLHRIVHIRHGRNQEHIITRGDNRIYREYVPSQWIIGVMTGYYPDESGMFISCTDEWYQKYLRTLKQQHCIRWIRAFSGRVIRKLLRR